MRKFSQALCLASLVVVQSTAQGQPYHSVYNVITNSPDEVPSAMSAFGSDQSVIFAAVYTGTNIYYVQKLTASGAPDWAISLEDGVEVDAITVVGSTVYLAGRVFVNFDTRLWVAAYSRSAGLIWATQIRPDDDNSNPSTSVGSVMDLKAVGSNSYLLLAAGACGNAAPGTCAPVLVKLAVATGAVTWGKSYPGAGVAGFGSVSLTDSGDVLAVGRDHAFGAGIAGLFNFTTGALLDLKSYTFNGAGGDNQSFASADHALWQNHTAFITGWGPCVGGGVCMIRTPVDTGTLAVGPGLRYSIHSQGQSITTNPARDHWGIVSVAGGQTWILTNSDSKHLCPNTQPREIQTLPAPSQTSTEYIATDSMVTSGGVRSSGITVSGWDANPGACVSDLSFETDQISFNEVDLDPGIDDVSAQSIDLQITDQENGDRYACGDKLSC